MKTQYLKCDNCLKLLEEDVSPAPTETYENARIHIDEATIFLPQSVVDSHTKECGTELHALSIENADFCNIKCLTTFVERYMKGEDVSAYNPHI